MLATVIWPVHRPANAVSSYRVSNDPGISFAVRDSVWSMELCIRSGLSFFLYLRSSVRLSRLVISFCLALQKRFAKTHENRQFNRVLARIRTWLAPNASTNIIFHDFIFRCATKKPLQVNVSQQLCHRRPATICEPMSS